MGRSAPRATAMSSWNMRASKRYRAWAQRMIGEHLDQRQMQDRRRLVRCLRSARTQRLVGAIAAWIRQGPWLERYKRRKRVEALQSYCARELDRWHRTADPQGPAPQDFGCVSPSSAADQGQALPLHAGSAHGKPPHCGAGANSVTCTSRQSDCSARWATCAISSASPTLPTDRHRPKMANEARSIRRAILIEERSCLSPPSRPIATSSTPGSADVAVRVAARHCSSLMWVNFGHPPVGYLALSNGAESLANLRENGDVQEHSGSYSLRTAGKAGD